MIIGADAKANEVEVLVDVEVEFSKASDLPVALDVAVSEACDVELVTADGKMVTAAVLITRLSVVMPPGEAVMVPIVVLIILSTLMMLSEMISAKLTGASVMLAASGTPAIVEVIVTVILLTGIKAPAETLWPPPEQVLKPRKLANSCCPSPSRMTFPEIVGKAFEK